MNWILLIIAGLFEVGFAAGLVKQLTNWQYSSFLDYCEKRNGTLYKKELFFKNSVLTVADIINRSSTEILPETISKLE